MNILDDFRIKQEMGKYYVVANSSVHDEEIYLVSMITENSIYGHLKCKKSYDNGKETLLYDVTNMITLEKEYENRYIEYNDLKNIFEEINKIYNAGGAYLLEEKYYVVNPSYIFKNMENDQICLLYVPGYEVSKKYSVLADFLIQKVNRKDTGCIQIAYQFYRMSSSDMFSISMFMNIIEKEQIIQKKDTHQILTEEEPKEYEDKIKVDELEDTSKIHWILLGVTLILIAAYYVYLRRTIYAFYSLIGMIFMSIVTVVLWIRFLIGYWEKQKEEDILIPERPVTVDEYWGNNTSEYDEETVILNSPSASGMRIEWKEGNANKEYKITNFPIVIGKLEGEVDCKISDTSISRIHAKMVKREGKIYIFDLNSTNGTSVDGVILRPGEERQIDDDSQIELGKVNIRMIC